MILPVPQINALIRRDKTRISVPKAGARTERYVSRPIVDEAPAQIGTIARQPHPPFKVGESYPIEGWVLKDRQTRRARVGRQVQCHVIVAEVIEVDLSRATDDDAHAEGFDDVAAFFDWWCEAHGHHPRVYSEFAGTEIPIETPAWVALIELDERRFLVDSGRMASDPDGHGYVRLPGSALPGEPESIEHELLDRYAQENQLTDAEREQARQDAWAELTLADRALHLERLAATSKVDISSELRLIDQKIAKAFKKLDRADRAA